MSGARTHLAQRLREEGLLLWRVHGGQGGVQPGADPQGLEPGGTVVEELILGLLKLYPLLQAGLCTWTQGGSRWNAVKNCRPASQDILSNVGDALLQTDLPQAP